MIVIGITGGLACGKTEAAKIIHRLTNAPIIDADKISHDLIKPKTKHWKKIVTTFGNRILKDDNFISREILAEIVFSSKTGLKKLEQILHPAIKSIIKEQIAEFAKSGEKAVVVDAPLLIEAGLGHTMDKIIVIYCSKKLQIERFAGKDRDKKLLAEKIIASQMPLKEKIRFADIAIKNDSSKVTLKNSLDKFLKQVYTMESIFASGCSSRLYVQNH